MSSVTMEKEEIIDKFTEFLREYYYNELVSAMSESRKFITVDFSLLDKFDPDLADYLAENPEEVFPLTEDATRQIDLPGEPKLKVRFVNLPENKQIRIRVIRAEHIGKLISVDGIVKRSSEVRPVRQARAVWDKACSGRVARETPPYRKPAGPGRGRAGDQ